MNICMSYGARNDISTALKSVADYGDTSDKTLDKRRFYENLVAGQSGPPQVLIRTSGVTRLSDFLIYQCSEFTTFYFLRETWPKFSLWNLLTILLHRAFFGSRRGVIGAYTAFSD